jgi:hypothetical protein
MSRRVVLGAWTMGFPEGGGHLWAYLNWALGLRAAGCEVVWLEPADPATTAADLTESVAGLRGRLAPFGLDDAVAVCSSTEVPLTPGAGGALVLDDISDADLLLNFVYSLPCNVVGRFSRTVLVDIDPGLLQVWMAEGSLAVAPHDRYLTTGETVGTPEARFPDAGLRWEHVPPPVALDAWSAEPADESSPFTTVSGWWDRWVQFEGEVFSNSKRDSYLEIRDLPSVTSAPLELALSLHPVEDAAERADLERRGWSVRQAEEVAGTADAYRRYIAASRGEFSCAKPSCMRLRNGWISDRTVCYLASGRPAVVQDTGPSRWLPYDDGVFRFATMDQAAAALEAVQADYAHHSRRARELAEECFDSRDVAGRALEFALN